MVRLVVVERMGWDSSVWTMDYNLPIKRFFPVFWLIHWRKKLLTIDTHLLSCACTTKSCFSATGSRRGGSRSFLTCKPQWCPSRCTEMQHSGIRNADNNFPPHKQKSSMKRKRRICKEKSTSIEDPGCLSRIPDPQHWKAGLWIRIWHGSGSNFLDWNPIRKKCFIFGRMERSTKKIMDLPSPYATRQRCGKWQGSQLRRVLHSSPWDERRKKII